METFRKRSMVFEVSDLDDDAGEDDDADRLSKSELSRIFCSKAILPIEEREQANDEQGASRSTKEQPKEHRRNAAGRYTVVVFVNSGSGGGVGKVIFDDVVGLFGSDFAFDLKSCKEGDMPEDKLERFALDPMVRVLACGGDGTAGWIESAIDKVWRRTLGPETKLECSPYERHLPLAILPLGTGNDLSRSLGWGGTYVRSMSGPSLVDKIASAELASLDRWRCAVVPMNRLDSEARRWVPKMLAESTDHQESKSVAARLETLFEDRPLARDAGVGTSAAAAEDGEAEEPPEQPEHQVFDGVFCNYFSIGMDAEVAYRFHQWRENNPEKAISPVVNKAVYLRNAPKALTAPLLTDAVQVLVNSSKGELMELSIPKACRAVLLLNIQSYGGGQKLTATGRADDGLIEVVFLSHKKAMSAALSQTMPMFKKCKVAARTDAVCIRTRTALHCQVDGEPWHQGEGIFQIAHYSKSAVLRRKKATRAPWNCMASNSS